MFVAAWGSGIPGGSMVRRPGISLLFFDATTGHKRTEFALQESLTQLGSCLKGSELGFWDPWDIANGTVERNAQWANMLVLRTRSCKRRRSNGRTSFIRKTGRAPGTRSSPWSRAIGGAQARVPDAAQGRWRPLDSRPGQGDATRRAGDGRRACAGTHTDITERKLLGEELTRQARVDELTGVHNRRFFASRLANCVARCVTASRCRCVLDVDRHRRGSTRAAGTRSGVHGGCRSTACRSTRGILEHAGCWARFIAQIGASNGARRAGACAAVARAPLPLEDGGSVQLGASFGVASMFGADDNLDATGRADRALYAAKDSGRNAVRS